jgi:hypothetical protein
VIKGNLKGLK